RESGYAAEFGKHRPPPFPELVAVKGRVDLEVAESEFWGATTSVIRVEENHSPLPARAACRSAFRCARTSASTWAMKSLPSNIPTVRRQSLAAGGTESSATLRSRSDNRIARTSRVSSAIIRPLELHRTARPA